MDIDKLEAGREMDALVAERVMGWKSESRNPEGLWYYNTEHGLIAVPHYSTDIAAAWRVHLKMCESDPATKARYLHELKDLLMERGPYSVWTASLEYLDPPTICRAALRAVAAEQEE